MTKVLIQPIYSQFERYKNFAQKHDLGFELLDFALSMNLDDRKECSKRIKFYNKVDSNKLFSMHGVFNDMRLSSTDQKIRKVVKNRLEHCCKIASELEINRVIFHTNYIPQISHSRYYELWEERNAEFFLGMIEKYGIEILLENVFDFTPRVLAGLMSRVNSDFLNVCFDLGHFNIHSRASLQDWFAVLGSNIKYMHINDNLGEQDTHAIIGTGEIDWKEFDRNIEEYNLSPITVLEVDIGNLKSIKESINYLEEHRIYPY